MPGGCSPPTLRRVWQRWGWRADVVLAVTLTAVGQWELWAGGEVPDGQPLRHRAVAAVCVATCTAAVAVRRSRPVQATLVAAAAVVLAALTVTAVDLVAVVLAQLVLVYSSAMLRDLRIGLLATAATTASSIPAAQDAGDVAFFGALCVAALVAGTIVRRQRLLATQLAAANALLGEERTLTRQLATEAERGRIARDMHDVLAHSLGVVVVQAEAAQDALDRDPAVVCAALDAIAGTSRESLTEVRRVLGGLRTPTAGPPSLEGLPSLLDAYRSAGVDVELRVTGRPVTVDAEVGATAYLIAREALTNVLRHAAGAPAVLEISYDDDELAVEVRDRGPGLDGSRRDSEHTGHGLLGIRERAARVRGRVECGDATGGGFRVLATLPTNGSGR